MELQTYGQAIVTTCSVGLILRLTPTTDVNCYVFIGSFVEALMPIAT